MLEPPGACEAAGPRPQRRGKSPGLAGCGDGLAPGIVDKWRFLAGKWPHVMR